MNPEAFVDVFREALGIVSLLVSATIIPSLLIGLVIVFRTKTIYAAIVTAIMQKEIRNILIRKEFR